MNIQRKCRDRDYVRIDSLPEAEREAFAHWSYRQTRPVIASELNADGTMADCAYRWDYARWQAERRSKYLPDPFDT